MERPTCETCPYWHHPDPDEAEGWCKRRCPAIVHDQLQHGGNGTNAYEAVWPDVHFDDWCGEHPDFPAYLASLKAEGDAIDPIEARVRDLERRLDARDSYEREQAELS